MEEHGGKVRFGVVGTNFITDWVIAGARLDERFELVAVYSRKQETADAFAAKHQIPYTFTSLEEMAKSPLIDAVYIASPNFLHAEQSILCMKHGKHVLCEKPFASNAWEVREMIAASAKYDVTLMEAMKPTLTPNFRSVRENLGRLGTIRRYFSCYCQYSSRYDKFKEGVVLNAFRPELSNGAMMDIDLYCLSDGRFVRTSEKDRCFRNRSFIRCGRTGSRQFRIRRDECDRSLFQDSQFILADRDTGRRGKHNARPDQYNRRGKIYSPSGGRFR